MLTVVNELHPHPEYGELSAIDRDIEPRTSTGKWYGSVYDFYGAMHDEQETRWNSPCVCGTCGGG